MLVILVILALSTLGAHLVGPHLELSPINVSGSHHSFQLAEILTLGGAAIGIAIVLMLLMRYWREKKEWRLRVLLRDGALLSIVWCSTGMVNFLLTTIPLDPNFYIFACGFSIVLMVVARSFRRKGRFFEGRNLGGWERTVPLGIMIVLAALVPAVLAGSLWAYKKYPRVQRLVNRLQSMAFAKETNYLFADVLAEVKFRQLIDFDIDERTGTYYVMERAGKIFRLDPTGGGKELLVDFSGLVGPKVQGEFGAYSFILHRSFSPQNQKCYAFFTSRPETGEPSNQLVEYDLSHGTPEAVFENRRTVLRIPTPSGYHNAGSLAYDPEGFLFVGLGEMASGASCQDMTALNGKILRIDPDKSGGARSFAPKEPTRREAERDYFIPHNNPFVAKPGVAHEIWALGLRNPFRAWWEPSLNGLVVGDVGQWTWEELNVVKAGGNCGWPFLEARDNYGGKKLERPDDSALTPPLHAYRHDSRDRSIVSGGICSGKTLEAFRGKLIFGDNFSGKVWAIDPEQDAKSRLIAIAPDFNQSGMTKIHFRPNGQILIAVMGAANRETGSIYELRERGAGESEPAPPAPRTAAQNYATHCALCHGASGDGKGMVSEQPGLNIAMPDFRTAAWQDGATDEHIRKTITEGGAAVGKNPVMAPFGGVLSASEIEEMLRYLRAFRDAASSAAPAPPAE